MKSSRNNPEAPEQSQTAEASAPVRTLKRVGLGVMALFIIKGIITTTLIIGAYFGLKGCGG